MFKRLVVIILGFLPFLLTAQLKVGGDPNAMNQNAVLQIENNSGENKGLLLPHVTSVDDIITSSIDVGLMVYVPNEKKVYVFVGAPKNWIEVTNASLAVSDQEVDGDRIIDLATHNSALTYNIGNQDVTMRLSTTGGFQINKENFTAFSVSEQGNVGVGISKPTTTLYIDGDKDDITDHDVLVVTNKGKVGIGTTEPQANLDINGSIKISENAGKNRFLVSDENGLATWGMTKDSILVDTHIQNFENQSISTDGEIRWSGVKLIWDKEIVFFTNKGVRQEVSAATIDFSENDILVARLTDGQKVSSQMIMPVKMTINAYTPKKNDRLLAIGISGENKHVKLFNGQTLKPNNAWEVGQNYVKIPKQAEAGTVYVVDPNGNFIPVKLFDTEMDKSRQLQSSAKLIDETLNGNQMKKLIDGDPSNFDGEEYLSNSYAVLDFGKPTTITGFYVPSFSGQREVKVSVSQDNIDFESVYRGKAGTYLNPVSLPKIVTVRYVKIEGAGSGGFWSPLEFGILGVKYVLKH